MVLPKKVRERPDFSKKFQNVANTLKNLEPPLKPEVELRILRAYRLEMCQQYCSNILAEVQKDSMKIQTLRTCNQLRLRALMLPKAAQIFNLGRNDDIQENLSF
jgi:hypothetical protein